MALPNNSAPPRGSPTSLPFFTDMPTFLRRSIRGSVSWTACRAGINLSFQGGNTSRDRSRRNGHSYQLQMSDTAQDFPHMWDIDMRDFQTAQSASSRSERV